MLAFIDNPQLLIIEFNDLIKVTQRKTFITVGIEIQKEEIRVIEDYRNDLDKLKKEFITRGLEKEANLIFNLENTLLSFQYELEMLVSIKEDDMDAAWKHLINAQMTIGSVIRNQPNGPTFLDNYVHKLSTYERLLFPTMTFSSVGGIIQESLCSICNDEYDKCNHIKGKVYMGEMCCQIIGKMDLEEISIVDDPANKHCRIMTIQSEGKTYDILTLREQEIKSS
jgi:hypothetical protein